MTRLCWTLPLRQRSATSSESKTNMTEEAHSCTSLQHSWKLKKGCETIWHHAKVCQNGCHKHSSLRFFCDVTSMCRVFETSWKQVSFILAREVAEIDHARVNCWCCTLQYFIWPAQEWNKMDQSRFDGSWLALFALSTGCFPSCFRHMCHVLAFSVSPIGAGLCSFQQAAFEVHLRQVGTKTASNQWHFRFQAHLFDHTDPLPGFQDHADANVEAKLAEIAFDRATVES